jgi:hypothetical protein
MFTHAIKSAVFTASLVLGGAFALAGCAVDAEDQAQDDQGNAESVGDTKEAFANQWTVDTSDELPPVKCDNGNLVSEVHCSGRYCDNVRLHCQQPASPVSFTHVDQTPYFSEENGSMTLCPPGEWVTGITCTGSYCDNISLTCSKIPGSDTRSLNCRQTGFFSEELGGTLSFPPGFFAVGAQCTGRYCDNMSFEICPK